MLMANDIEIAPIDCTGDGSDGRIFVGLEILILDLANDTSVIERDTRQGEEYHSFSSVAKRDEVQEEVSLHVLDSQSRL